MAHYPYRTDLSDEFGIAPHTDTSFLTLLAPNEVHSLSIRTQTGKRIDARSIPGAFAVNGGQLLPRWTNDYFLPTPASHCQSLGCRALRAGLLLRRRYRLADRRYADPHQAGQSAKYATTRYTEYMIDYQQGTCNMVGSADKGAVQ